MAPIHIIELDPVGFKVGFETRQYHPQWYSAELPEDEFLKFIEGELRNAGFLRSEYRKAVRNTKLDTPLNNFRSPYDLTRLDE